MLSRPVLILALFSAVLVPASAKAQEAPSAEPEVLLLIGDDSNTLRVARYATVCSLSYAVNDGSGGFIFSIGRTPITSQFVMTGPENLGNNGDVLRLERMQSLRWNSVQTAFSRGLLANNQGFTYAASLAELGFDMSDLEKTIIFELANLSTGEKARVNWGSEIKQRGVAAMNECLNGLDQVWTLERP